MHIHGADEGEVKGHVEVKRSGGIWSCAPLLGSSLCLKGANFFISSSILFKLGTDDPWQSVLIERVATPEVSSDWSIAQKSSSSSSISINNGGYYDINNEPLLSTHTLRMGMQKVCKISPYFCAPTFCKCVPA